MQPWPRLLGAEFAGLAHKVEVARDRILAWPSSKLSVLAEHSALFYDLMPPQVVEQVCCRIRHALVPLGLAWQAAAERSAKLACLGCLRTAQVACRALAGGEELCPDMPECVHTIVCCC